MQKRFSAYVLLLILCLVRDNIQINSPFHFEVLDIYTYVCYRTSEISFLL